MKENRKDFCSCVGLSMREGVGKDSRHKIGYVDIQVGSCICLSVCLC